MTALASFSNILFGPSSIIGWSYYRPEIPDLLDFIISNLSIWYGPIDLYKVNFNKYESNASKKKTYAADPMIIYHPVIFDPHVGALLGERGHSRHCE